ncbi:MAG: type II secretion system protein [Rhodospirillales bacterium]|nr:type II secretion system protein [Acetobacter sp.]
MINKKSMTAAFTLIELLVVITIIGILAGIALPVFNTVQVRGQQTKSLAQAKQIGLALKVLAGDNDGVYPKNGVPATIIAAPANSNDAFSSLFPQYTQSETIFGNKLAVGWQTGSGPDNKIDNPAIYPPNETLKAGENVYGYMMGLSDASNPACPLVFDASGQGDTTGTYSATQTAKGGVWSAQKAIVIYLDNHGAVENVSSATKQVMFTDPTNGSVSVLDPTKDSNLTGCTFLNPK